MMVWSLFACMGLDQETNISELRVVAIQSEPAELSVSEFQLPISEEDAGFGFSDREESSTAPDIAEPERPTANILIADPLKEGYQWAVWQCTSFGDECLEAEFFDDDLSAWITVGEGTALELQVPLVLNPVWLGLLQNPELPQPVGVTGLWVLACAPNQCDILTRALRGDWDREAFANPFDLMVSLPLERTALSVKSLYVSQESNPETRLQNPTIAPLTDEEIRSSFDTPAEIGFGVELFQRDPDTASIYGYATIGGFDANSLANNILDSLLLEKTLNWYVSEDDQQGEAELFVVVDDGLGGIGYWSQTATVE